MGPVGNKEVFSAHSREKAGSPEDAAAGALARQHQRPTAQAINKLKGMPPTSAALADGSSARSRGSSRSNRDKGATSSARERLHVGALSPTPRRIPEPKFPSSPAAKSRSPMAKRWVRPPRPTT